MGACCFADQHSYSRLKAKDEPATQDASRPSSSPPASPALAPQHTSPSSSPQNSSRSPYSHSSLPLPSRYTSSPSAPGPPSLPTSSGPPPPSTPPSSPPPAWPPHPTKSSVSYSCRPNHLVAGPQRRFAPAEDWGLAASRGSLRSQKGKAAVRIGRKLDEGVRDR